MMKLQKPKDGFTLLETMVALAVILAAVVGPASLITRGLLSFSFAKNKVIAVNLAQEGIELVRAVRDNNVICDYLNGSRNWQWDRDPEGGSITKKPVGVSVDSLITGFDCNESTLNISMDMPKLSAPCTANLGFDSVTKHYGYNAGAQSTGFKRCVTIEVNPTNDPDDSFDLPADADIAPKDQMDIISTVTWDERGMERKVELRERLYNWR